MKDDPFKMPLFFKLWFAFILLVIVCIGGFSGYAIMQVVNAGPEGIGRAIGSVIKGVNEGSHQ